MSTRTKARKRALDILFESELRGLPLDGTLAERLAGERPVNPYTVRIVEGVAAEQDTIDGAISARSQGWSLRRMPNVDRNILRIGVWELLFNDEVPDAVVIAEAVRIARELSGEESPPFVNGVLAAVSRDKGHPPKHVVGD